MMVTSIASLACAMKQQQLGMEVGTKLLKTAMDAGDEHGESLDKLLEQSAKTLELSVQPNLGSNLDIKA